MPPLPYLQPFLGFWQADGAVGLDFRMVKPRDSLESPLRRRAAAAGRTLNPNPGSDPDVAAMAAVWAHPEDAHLYPGSARRKARRSVTLPSEGPGGGGGKSLGFEGGGGGGGAALPPIPLVPLLKVAGAQVCACSLSLNLLP